MQLINFMIAALVALSGSAMAVPTTENVHARSLMMARDILDGIIEGRSLEIRAWTRAQERALAKANENLRKINDERGKPGLTDEQRDDLRRRLIRAQAERSNLIALKNAS